jgi:hypothetical protein
MVEPWGQFALDPSYSATLGNFVVASDQNGYEFLEKCGSHLHHSLPGVPITGNSSALVLSRNSKQLAGILLPSLRSFVTPLPAALRRGADAAVVLSSRTLYVVAHTGQLWQAPAPALVTKPR